MSLHPDFPTSPYEPLIPEQRWFPADEALREKSYDKLLPPLVAKLREEIHAWRASGYPGASSTSRALLRNWFETEHLLEEADGSLSPFRYYFAQREAVETVVWLYEVRQARDKFDLLRFSSMNEVSPAMFDEDWPRYVLKMATGAGKTKVLSLLIAWSFFHRLYEENSTLSRNFLVIAPNIIVLDRLRADFDGLRIFFNDPILPTNGYEGQNWRDDFQLTLHIQDDVRVMRDSGVTPNDACDTDTGANNRQNFPVLTLASNSGGTATIQGTLNSTPNTMFTIEFFSNDVCDPSGFGEGQTYIGSTTVITDGNCNASFTFTGSVSSGHQFITATATDTNGNTSEFSACGFVNADLSISKSASPSPVLTGSDLTYSIAVNYSGPAPAVNVTVTDNLPSQTTFKSISAPFGWTCTTPAIGSNGTVSCTKTTMAPSESPATFTIVATVDCSVADGTSISDTATVSSSTTDADPANNSSTATVTASNPPPSITCPANITMVDNVPGSCGASVDPGTPATSDNCGINSVVGVRSDSKALTDLYPVGATTINWVVTDASGNTASCLQTITVTNPSPVVSITGPPSGSLYAVNTPVNFTGSFTDNAGDTHSAVWTFDGTPQAGIVNEATRTVSASHTFDAAGVYLVTLTVTDDCGQTGTTNQVGGFDALVVIYDPDAGFVTGGGWINSPSGAYAPNPSLVGKANFGFVSKYQKGANVPDGQTEFQFKVANLNFHSTIYEWLVVAGARAQYKGSGTINGAGNYGFMLTAIDGEITGGGGIDKFRIKIWDKNNGDAVVYDNQMGAGIDDNPTTALAGGSIVVHK